jgi:hypothetical protein
MFVPGTRTSSADKRDPDLLAELRALREELPVRRGSTMQGRRSSRPPLAATAPLPTLAPIVSPPRAPSPCAPPRRAPSPTAAEPPPRARRYGPVQPHMCWDAATLAGRDADAAVADDGAVVAKTAGVLTWRTARAVGAVDNGAAEGASIYWEVVVEAVYAKELSGRTSKEPTHFIGVCLPGASATANPCRSAACWFFSVESGSVFNGGFQRRLARGLHGVRKLGATFGLRLTQPRGCLEVFLNGESLGIAFENVPRGVHAACALSLPGEAARMVTAPHTAYEVQLPPLPPPPTERARELMRRATIASAMPWGALISAHTVAHAVKDKVHAAEERRSQARDNQDTGVLAGRRKSSASSHDRQPGEGSCRGSS